MERKEVRERRERRVKREVKGRREANREERPEGTREGTPFRNAGPREGKGKGRTPWGSSAALPKHKRRNKGR